MWLQGYYLPYWSFPLFVLAGMLVSFINSIAGGGGLVSFTTMIFFGLPASLANGTNRLGVLLGSASSTYTFQKQGHFNWALSLKAAIPAAFGSIVGAWLAVKLPDKLFNPILAVIIVAVVLATIKHQAQKPKSSELTEPYLASTPLALLAYTLVGFYGGFLQIGIGFVIMYTFSRLGRLSIFQINALKTATTFLYSLTSISLFAFSSKIHWPIAISLAIGNVFGGIFGSHWQVKKGEAWVNRFLMVMGFIVASKLSWDTFK